MKHKKYLSIISFSAISLFMASCSTENIDMTDNTQTPGNTESEGYFITLTAEANENKSRTHWDIDTDNSLKFVWDESTDDMISFVKRDGALLNFSDDTYYSLTTVEPDQNTINKASLKIVKGLKNPYQDNDVIWSVSPVKAANINSADGSASVEFTLPDGYVQTDITTTNHLIPYVFMTGKGTVSNNSASLSFTPLTAIYRFKIMNNDTEKLNVTEVGITGPFRNKAVIGVNETTTYSVSPESGTYTIKVTTGETGIDIANGKTAYLYALVFPTETANIEDNITLYIKGKYGEVSADYEVTAACNAVYKFNLDSNKYYDMLVPVSRQGIVFSGIEIDEFAPGGSFDVTIEK